MLNKEEKPITSKQKSRQKPGNYERELENQRQRYAETKVERERKIQQTDSKVLDDRKKRKAEWKKRDRYNKRLAKQAKDSLSDILDLKQDPIKLYDKPFESSDEEWTIKEKLVKKHKNEE